MTAAHTPPEAVTACSLDLPSNQAMRCSKSFRALVLFGVVALVAAFYQSIMPPSTSAVTVTIPLKPRQRVQPRPRSR